MTKQRKYHSIVIGTSAGGLHALTVLLEKLPTEYPFPIIIVQHRSKDHKELLEEILQKKCKIRIKQADEKESIENGIVYIAPPNYHLLIETDRSFSLSSEVEISYSRPSIDVLFESAAIVYKDQLTGIILTGANSDGASGIKTIKKNGGTTIAQSPAEAEFALMPMAAVQTNKVDFILTLQEIYTYLLNLIER